MKLEEVKEKNYISFSEYSVFRLCPFKWYTQYYLKEQSPTNEFLVFGKALHSTIEQIVKEKPSRILYSKLFEANFKKESNGVFVSSFFGRNIIQDAVALIEKLDYFKRFNNLEPTCDETGKIISLEEELFEPAVIYKNTPLFFKGLIDYSAKYKDEDKFVIMDWKTSLKPWNLDKKVGLLNFNDYFGKLINKEKLTEEENKDLQAKIFFGQTVLYKHYYAQKYKISKDQIEIRYCVLTRQPIEVQEYKIEIQDLFFDYIISDFQQALIEIYELKKKSQKEVEEYIFTIKEKGKKNSILCQYCDLKKRC